MEQLTNREKELIEIIKKLINICTFMGLALDRMKELHVWISDSFKSQGLGSEWQNEMLHTLEEKYGLIYKKLDPQSLKVIEEEIGNQDT